MELEEMLSQRYIGEYLTQESIEERDIQCQLQRLIMWEFVFPDVYHRRDTVERTHGIRFEIHPKEKGHNIPHCHASYQGQEISLSLIDGKVIAGNVPKQQERFAVEWVKHNLPVLQSCWDKYHVLEV